MVAIFQLKAMFCSLIPVKIRSINKMESLEKMLDWFVSAFCLLRDQGPTEEGVGVLGVLLLYSTEQGCRSPGTSLCTIQIVCPHAKSQDPKWMLEAAESVIPLNRLFLSIHIHLR